MCTVLAQNTACLELRDGNIIKIRIIIVVPEPLYSPISEQSAKYRAPVSCQQPNPRKKTTATYDASRSRGRPLRDPFTRARRPAS